MPSQNYPERRVASRSYQTMDDLAAHIRQIVAEVSTDPIADRTRA